MLWEKCRGVKRKWENEVVVEISMGENKENKRKRTSEPENSSVGYSLVEPIPASISLGEPGVDKISKIFSRLKVSTEVQRKNSVDGIYQERDVEGVEGLRMMTSRDHVGPMLERWWTMRGDEVRTSYLDQQETGHHDQDHVQVEISDKKVKTKVQKIVPNFGNYFEGIPNASNTTSCQSQLSEAADIATAILNLSVGGEHSGKKK